MKSLTILLKALNPNRDIDLKFIEFEGSQVFFHNFAEVLAFLERVKTKLSSHAVAGFVLNGLMRASVEA